MKRIVLGALFVAMIMSGSACGSINLSILATATPTATNTPTPTMAPTPTKTPTATPKPKPTATPLPPCELSGTPWVARFPTSVSPDDLTPAFREALNRFIAALKAAGASVKISATYRPRERAYLMHYAYRIARENLDPGTVPAMEGVNICWVHHDAKGNPNLVASKQAAELMVVAYAIAYPPALNSRHTERRAIDMTLAWQGDLNIVDANGKVVSIKSEPRNGNNTNLHKVGATYGAIKLVSDPPHWSDDGR